MAKLLETSITTDGFGPRGEFEDEGIPRDPVALVLEKMTLNLVEQPRAGCTREKVPSREDEADMLVIEIEGHDYSDFVGTCCWEFEGVEDVT